MAKVAFIGLGNMGGGMAANLVKAGFDVIAFDLSPAALKASVEAGCTAATSAAQAVENADYVISMLPNGAIVESIYIDGDKLLDVIPKTALVIDCSTIAAQNSRRLAREAGNRGIRCIDAPVSGGVAAADAGTLAFMCGGKASHFESARAVLSAMGAKLFLAGDSGAGQVAKMCNNMLLAVHMIGTAESLQLGVDNGLDPAVLSEIMLNSSGANWSLEKYNPYPGVMEGAPASRDYQGGFMNMLMLKDLGLALDAANGSKSSVPMGSLARSLYALHAGKGNELRDFSSIIEQFKKKE